MKRKCVETAALLAILMMAYMYCGDQTTAAPKKGAPGGAITIERLPDSLSQYYSNKTITPAYLTSMIQLSIRFNGIMGDVSEGDVQGAGQTFEKFKDQYQKVGNFVPEWKSFYPMEPVNSLGAAIKTGDKGKISSAFDIMGAVCQKCHDARMVQTTHKYRWGDFKNFKFTDPSTKREVSYLGLMKMIGSNLSGIYVNSEQGQYDNASKQLIGLSARFAILKTSCGGCHNLKRVYYVGSSSSPVFEDLEKEIKKSKPDLGEITERVEDIELEICDKCHLVHMPAMIAKRKMR